MVDLINYLIIVEVVNSTNYLLIEHYYLFTIPKDDCYSRFTLTPQF